MLQVESFDPTTELWTQLTNYDFELMAGLGLVLDGKLIVFGGEGADDRKEEVMAYDPTGDTWEHVMDVEGGISNGLALRYNG